MLNKFKAIVALFLICLIGCAYAGGVEEAPDRATAAPLYIGATVGYGTTVWSLMVAQRSDSLATFASPIHAKDDGVTGGVIIGYYFSRYFALEATYVHFPDTSLAFLNPTVYSVWQDNYDGYDYMKSRSFAVGVSAKFIIPIKYIQHLHVFASVGGGAVLRRDFLTNDKTVGHASGIFGAGFIYNFPHHILSQIGFQLFTGYGKASSEPVLNYIPFLWQVNLALAYQIAV